ncbi:YbbR-like domain-containing protein [Clostridium carnis]
MDKRDKGKRQIIVPIICILMSIGLWFYVTNVENKVRTTEINKVPVELINLESLEGHKMVLAPKQQFYVNLKLEGYTNYINKVKKSDFKIQVDLSEYALKKGENKIPVTITDYPTGVSIKNNNMLSINIALEDLVEKEVEVQSNIAVSARQGYFAGPAVINPKEVKISGPESIISKVYAVVANGERKDVYEDIIEDYNIKAVDSAGNAISDVIFSQNSVSVNIKVSKGKSVPLKVNTVGELQNGGKLKSIESTRRSVELLGPKETLDSINEVETLPVDLSQIKDSGELTVAIKVPNGVHLLAGEETTTVKLILVKTVTKEFDVKFTIHGVNQGLIVKPDKEIVKVKINGLEDEITNITADNIKVDLNLETYKDEGHFDITPVVTLTGLSQKFTVNSVENIGITVTKEVTQKPEVTSTH